jgi:hypothetical protein
MMFHVDGKILYQLREINRKKQWNQLKNMIEGNDVVEYLKLHNEQSDKMGWVISLKEAVERYKNTLQTLNTLDQIKDKESVDQLLVNYEAAQKLSSDAIRV